MSLYHLIVLLFLFFVFFIMLMIVSFFIFFFFSSRRRHTRFDCDWSSDVCSSDLVRLRRVRRHVVGVVDEDELRIRIEEATHEPGARGPIDVTVAAGRPPHETTSSTKAASWSRSEERRVGKEWRARR